MADAATRGWHTPEEAATRLGVTPRTLINWEARGWIAAPEKSPGGRRRFSEEALRLIEAADIVSRGKARGKRTDMRTSGGSDGKAGAGDRAATVIAVVNHKGGSAKTTSVINLAGAFAAEMGRRTLVVDVDSQANCTIGLGFSPYQLAAKKQIFISDVLLPAGGSGGGGGAMSAGAYQSLHSVRDAILETSVPGVDLVPSSLSLSDVEFPLINLMARETMLARALLPVRADYDVVLIDCPPSLGIFTANALWAADYVLVPVEAANYAVAGLTAIVNVVKVVRDLGRDVSILGVFNTRVPAPLTNPAREAMENTRRIFASSYIDTPIATAVASEKAVDEGQPLVLSAPRHKVAVAYRELAGEVLRRAGIA